MAIKKNLYVHDYVESFTTKNEAVQFRHEWEKYIRMSDDLIVCLAEVECKNVNWTESAEMVLAM